MVVMWDMDGVLANFTAGYHALANKMFGLKLSLDPPPTWDWLEDRIGSENVGKIWNNIKQSKTFWRDLPSLVGQLDWERIANLKAEQYFVTSRVGKEVRSQTNDWLQGQFEWTATVPEYSVLVSNRKAEAANFLKANYVIDDKAGNAVVTAYLSPPERRTYILDTPYNRFDPKVLGSKVKRVSTVGAFLADIEAGR